MALEALGATISRPCGAAFPEPPSGGNLLGGRWSSLEPTGRDPCGPGALLVVAVKATRCRPVGTVPASQKTRPAGFCRGLIYRTVVG